MKKKICGTKLESVVVVGTRVTYRGRHFFGRHPPEGRATRGIDILCESRPKADELLPMARASRRQRPARRHPTHAAALTLTSHYYYYLYSLHPSLTPTLRTVHVTLRYVRFSFDLFISFFFLIFISSKLLFSSFFLCSLSLNKICTYSLFYYTFVIIPISFKDNTNLVFYV